jgi:acyl-CoA reductase-like NAD-dependent aldehyde dehydrogenase
VENIRQVAGSAVEGVFYNNGQSCCAVKRIYVHKKVYSDFTKNFLEELKKWKVGDPTDKDTMIGPVSRKEHLNYLHELVKDAVARGAALQTPLAISEKKQTGYFFTPAVLLNANHSMRIMKEEAFGPVIGIQKVKDDHEAAALMQETEYGLTASVYSKDKQRAEKLLSRMNTGTAYWNCCDRVSPYLPWSGRKHSGLGATLSHLGIRAFAKPKGWHLRG